ncbi:PIR protein [Plasmodium vivax]|nr:PIR protein [Plasmodium vivax]
MTEEYETNCPLSIFIKRLNNKSYNTRFESVLELRAIVGTNKDIIKDIGCSLYSGYDYLSARYNDNERTDFCNYLNLWLDEQKSTHANSDLNITEKEWELIDELWQNLKQRVHIGRLCDRKEEKNKLEIKKRINLMVYCVNRDYFMNFCSRAINNNNNIENRCSVFSRFTDKYYAQFWEESGCFDDTINPKDHRYFISEKCDLHNMAMTFPKFDSSSKEIVYDHESRKPIEKCKNTIQSGGDHNELAVVSAQLPGDTALTKVDGIGSGSSPVVRVSSPAGLENYYRDTNDLAPPPSTEVSLTDTGLSKRMYYAGLSLSGVFFTSMVLYKYTTLGPFIRSLVSKKENLRQTTNKHLAEQWLQKTSEYMDSNSENSHYNFPYHSMQN